MNTKFFSSSLFISIFALMGIGLVQVYSSSYILATEAYGDGLFFFKKQLLFTLLSLLMLFAATQVPHHYIRNYGWLLWMGAALLITLTFVSGIGVRVGGAQRWLDLPFGFRFEPAELLKISFSFLFASLVVRKSHMLRKVKWGWTSLIIVLPLIALLKQPDFGSFAIIGLVGMSLLFARGMSLKWFGAGALASLPVLYLLIWNVPYRKARVQAFLDPWVDSAGKGFQVIQSMLSVHNGGLTGQGLGQGQGKLFFLPEAHTDFTMAVFSEELGFVGLFLILALFAFIIFRGFQIALRARDDFSKTLALGLIITFAYSVFINMGVVLGILPTKGLTMPFLSYGGSSLLIMSFLFGILLNIEMSEK